MNTNIVVDLHGRQAQAWSHNDRISMIATTTNNVETDPNHIYGISQHTEHEQHSQWPTMEKCRLEIEKIRIKTKDIDIIFHDLS